MEAPILLLVVLLVVLLPLLDILPLRGILRRPEILQGIRLLEILLVYHLVGDEWAVVLGVLRVHRLGDQVCQVLGLISELLRHLLCWRYVRSYAQCLG